MIILLTGEPASGKTTVVETFLQRFQGDCRWVLTPEIIEHGQRTGYEAVNETGERVLFAHQTAVSSQVVVGSHEYRVDTHQIDRFYTKPLTAAIAEPPDLFVLDEIGNMQRLSPNFKRAVSSAFAHNLSLVATIRNRDKWTTRYRRHPYAVCLAVTPLTRDQLPDLLVTVCSQLPTLVRFTPPLRQTILDATRRYAADNQLIQLQKLYGHALRYFTQHRIEITGPNSFIVQGDHGSSRTTIGAKPSCDCDLFNGRGDYAGVAGDCSHLMAARLMKSAT